MVGATQRRLNWCWHGTKRHRLFKTWCDKNCLIESLKKPASPDATASLKRDLENEQFPNHNPHPTVVLQKPTRPGEFQCERRTSKKQVATRTCRASIFSRICHGAREIE